MSRRDSPWVLGARLTAIDVFLMVMVHCKRGEALSAAKAPQLLAAAQAAAALPAFAPVIQRNFG